MKISGVISRLTQYRLRYSEEFMKIYILKNSTIYSWRNFRELAELKFNRDSSYLYPELTFFRERL